MQNATPKRGRPSKAVIVNIEVKAKTREALKELKRVTGLRTQGEVLDHLLADVMRRRPPGR
jgi:hypothetical protein